jgi:hypothetical protein
MAGNVSEELSRLAALRDQGVLTQEEFDIQKVAVLRGEQLTATEAIAPAAAKKKYGKGCVILIAIIVSLMVVGALVGGNDAKSPAASGGSTTAPVVEPTKVSANELFAAYQANEASAQGQYGDRPLLVSGTVDGVDLDMTNDPVVKLRTSNEFMSAMANLTDASKPKASGLSKGEKVTLLCKNVGEVMGIPQLRDCDIQ